MPYITSAERIGMERGILQNAREMLKEAVEVRFQTIPKDITDILEKIENPMNLKSLHRFVITCANLDEFREKLELTG